MKVKVTRKFRDKYTGELHKKGDCFEITEERYNEIMSVGEFVYKIAQDDALSVSSNEVNTLSNGEEETPTNDSGTSDDGFDIMSVRELKEYADKTYKMTFGRGTKKAEIIEALRKMEQINK